MCRIQINDDDGDDDDKCKRTHNVHPEFERNELFRLVDVDQLVQHERQADFYGLRGILHWSGEFPDLLITLHQCVGQPDLVRHYHLLLQVCRSGSTIFYNRSVRDVRWNFQFWNAHKFHVIFEKKNQSRSLNF